MSSEQNFGYITPFGDVNLLLYAEWMATFTWQDGFCIQVGAKHSECIHDAEEKTLSLGNMTKDRRFLTKPGANEVASERVICPTASVLLLEGRPHVAMPAFSSTCGTPLVDVHPITALPRSARGLFKRQDGRILPLRHGNNGISHLI